MGRTGFDSFARDNLPPPELWPDFINLEKLGYPERLNAAAELVDGQVARGRGGHPAVVGPTDSWTYAELAERVNRVANVLLGETNFQPGNRVLIRSANKPMMVAIYFAVLKAGGIVVATMPLLRPRELRYIIAKAQVTLAFCDEPLKADLAIADRDTGLLRRTLLFSTDAPDGLEASMQQASPHFEAADTASDDVCLIGFTSGTTGEAKATMHFHRDILAICDCFPPDVLQPGAEDVFIGSPPLAFTFGLGGLVLFPFRVGATAVLLERASPDDLLPAIERRRATICFTTPVAYRAMLPKLKDFDLSSLRKCVSAGEMLPTATWHAWLDATGIRIIDGIGSTEMLHIFISAAGDAIRPGATGKPVRHYEAKVIGPDGADLPPGEAGRLAVRGPTGCRYLADERQRAYVQDGWNLTGDTYVRDAEGYFWFQARSDDMIISAGYNIAGPEIEDALLAHPAVAECGVVGAPDPERGQIVKAYVVLAPAFEPGPALTEELQLHVKAELAPYKYPRAIEYLDRLPRTETGKLQRFQLRAMAAAAPSGQS